VPVAVNRQENLVQIPFVTGSRPAATEFVGVVLTELATPFADGLVGHDNTPFKQQFLDVAVRRG
jgi:hypothetical protein